NSELRNPAPGFRDIDLQTSFRGNSCGPDLEGRVMPAHHLVAQSSENRKTSPHLPESQYPAIAPMPFRGLVKSSSSSAVSGTDRPVRGAARARPVYEGRS